MIAQRAVLKVDVGVVDGSARHCDSMRITVDELRSSSSVNPGPGVIDELVLSPVTANVALPGEPKADSVTLAFPLLPALPAA